jgi:hypothetical protein
MAVVASFRIFSIDSGRSAIFFSSASISAIKVSQLSLQFSISDILQLKFRLQFG